MPIYISLDSETWGKRAGFDARSLGACLFDPALGMVGGNHKMFEKDNVGWVPEHLGYEFYQACDNRLQGSYSPDHYSPSDLDKLDYRTGASRQYHLKRDPETVDWWYSRPADAQAAFANPIDLKLVLEKLSLWMASVGVDPKDENSARIWSHGAAFDPPLIEELYHVVDLPVPWHYRAPRDTRTLFDVVGIDNHSNWLKQFNEGILHHALDDAETQARGICEAWSIALRHIPHLTV